MAFTRFNYDESRTKKHLQQSTGPGRWVMNVPGNGSKPCYMEDSHIRIQKWGANLRTNTINLESDLLGVNRQIGKDCLGKDNYLNYNVPNEAIQYPSCKSLTTAQSRATNPAWWYRDKEQVDWYYPPLNPQENTCVPFLNNLNTRILEKDYFTPKRDCIITDSNDRLPTNVITGGYVGGPTTCEQGNSCGIMEYNNKPLQKPLQKPLNKKV
jgi:hypothetical protein